MGLVATRMWATRPTRRVRTPAGCRGGVSIHPPPKRRPTGSWQPWGKLAEGVSIHPPPRRRPTGSWQPWGKLLEGVSIHPPPKRRPTGSWQSWGKFTSSGGKRVE